MKTIKTKTNMLATNKKVIKNRNLQATKSTTSTSSHRRRPAAAMSLLFIFILVILINISCVDCLYQQQSPHHAYHGDGSKGLVNLEAKVGSHVVFNCRIDFPYDYDIPYIIHWSKDVSKVRWIRFWVKICFFWLKFETLTVLLPASH